MANKKREFCVNAIHRLNQEEPKRLSPNSTLYCEECLERAKNRPKIPFNPDALRGV